MRTLGEIK